MSCKQKVCGRHRDGECGPDWLFKLKVADHAVDKNKQQHIKADKPGKEERFTNAERAVYRRVVVPTTKPAAITNQAGRMLVISNSRKWYEDFCQRY